MNLEFLTMSMLIGFAGVCCVLIVITAATAIWMARGEPDVNGDPERDAGWTDREIEERSRSWDHGSDATESRSNLDYSRRLNRAALRRAAGH